MEIQKEKTNDTAAFDSGAKIQTQEKGRSGTEIHAGYFSEEYLQELRGRRGAKVFDEMRRSESQVAMLLNAVMNPIKSAVWEFEAAQIPNGELHKELIEYNAKECIDWEAHLHEVLTFLIHGYSLFEVVHSVIFNHPKFGTVNGLKGLAFRNQKTIERWNVSKDTGALETVEQYVQGDLSADYRNYFKMSADFLLVFSLHKEGDNYEGLSALRPMYGPWFRKNLYLKLAAIGVEKNAIGTPVGTIPAGKVQAADEINAFKNVLGSFVSHEAAYMLKPEGWEVEIIKNDFDPSKIKELILLENTEMINSLVANFLALGTNGSGGAFALGSDLSDFFLTGLQCYANIISGVWNRKLIPNLVKMNFGPQDAYPKLKSTGINDKAGKELADIISTLTNSQAIKADMKLEEFLRKQYSLPAADPLTAREKPAAAPFTPRQFSENIKLAEGYRSKWNQGKKEIKEVMQSGLKELLNGYTKQVRSAWDKAGPQGRRNMSVNFEPKNLSKYSNDLKEVLAKVALDALKDAQKETPKASKKNIKLSESIKLAAPKGGYFEALPPKIKNIVKNQAGLIAQTQAADLNKIVSFQFFTNADAALDVEQIVADIESIALPAIEDGSTRSGFSVDAAAGNATSSAVNQARLEWFFEPEVLEGIESFTFFNEDPVSEICQELDGTTWAVNDPDLDRYSPPLHHNCKSRLVPNEKGDPSNPEIDRGGTAVSDKALKSMTLSECVCGYGMQFEERQKLNSDEQKKVSDKIALLVNEGYDQEQAAAIAYDMQRKGKL